VLLAGDAAHIHSALGGQGLNVGLGDAMNLGWKLAASIWGTAPADLLDTYHAERHPIGRWVLDWTRAQSTILKPTPQAKAMQAIVRDLVGTRDGATYIAGNLWGIALHYDLGGGHPLVGYSAPDLAFDDGRRLAHHLRGGIGALIDLTHDQALRTAAHPWRDRIGYVSGATENALGLSALLVRPDGFVAWASEGTPDRTGFERAAARWFGAPAPQHGRGHSARGSAA
jgi:pentachlorophenol monooxygenase